MGNPAGTSVAELQTITAAEGWSGTAKVQCNDGEFSISGDRDYYVYTKNICNIGGPPGAGSKWERLSSMVDMRKFEGDGANCSGIAYCEGCVCTYALNALNGMFTFEQLKAGTRRRHGG